jgi:threonine aldolase
MADAEVGDDVYGEDPTINRLEARAAELVGKDVALFVPSGTMANQLALRLLAPPGSEVACGERAHVYRYEGAAAARNAGIQLRPLADPDGVLAPAQLEEAIADQAHHLPPLSALAIENTHMPASGRPWRAEAVEAIAAVARRHRLRVHCDGARIWNAAAAVGRTPAQLAAPCDTVMFCLSTGLAAPVGSLLCGSVEVMAGARAERARLGGAMRQAGVIAAAGLVALEEMVARLPDDHARARRLADALADRFPGSVDPESIETNIVCAPMERLPDKIVARLEERGVRCGTIDSRTVRFVTHKDVDDEGIDRVITALDALAR